jgi:hypothetical protein
MQEENPSVVIRLDGENPYANLDWDPYKGMTVDVVYRRKGSDDASFPQIVTSSELIGSEDEELAGIVNEFLVKGAFGMYPYHGFKQCGTWVMRGQKTYTSETFTSHRIESIMMEDAFNPLLKTFNEISSRYPEENIKNLIMMYMHPFQNAPVSVNICSFAEKLAKQMGIKDGESIQMMAIPINEGGNLIFRYDVYG